jgi:hypothetical protein
MNEIVTNLHMHTPYSDGHYTHPEIVRAALKTGLDAVIVTDHNVWVNGPEDYYRDGDRRVLMLVGEEVHDQGREPQKNHLLVFGANREMATLAHDPQLLIEGVKKAGGISFIAHPVDPAAPAVGEPDISWESWDVLGFNGIELWNGFSEFKTLLKSRLHAVFYAYFPQRIARGPLPDALRRWDGLLSKDRRVVAIGGSDAHALPASMGPLRRTLFPYEFHFRAVNTHLLLPTPLSGEVAADRRLVLEALERGHAFIGYDLPASTSGFRFSAQGKDAIAWMGDELPAKDGVTLQVRMPRRAECRLLKDGKALKIWRNRETCTHITAEPGVYRVEVHIDYLGRQRGWIYSNPIYVRE